MAVEQPSKKVPIHRQIASRRIRRADSYGIVLLLIVLDYIAVSASASRGWGKVAVVVLLGVTLLFALRTSQARAMWQLLAALYLLASTLITVVSIYAPGAFDFSQQTSIAAGLLLLVTPVVILRRIITHQVVTTETVLGAVCVYLLIGFSFAFIYLAAAFLSATPFFAGQSSATTTEYLFFSYTTLTTVGYGNLVPAGNVGQTFAMLEALFGQIFLVIVVARLVSLWGQAGPRASTGTMAGSAGDDTQRDQRGTDQQAAMTPADITNQDVRH